MNYSEKLRDPRWQKRRLEVFQRDEFRCSNCADSSSTLHCHHEYYIKGREPWEYPLIALSTLCKTCHDEISNEPTRMPDFEQILSSCGPRLTGLLLFLDDEAMRSLDSFAQEEFDRMELRDKARYEAKKIEKSALVS